ncbi:FecR family protein [Opitutaceae bacterium]
MNDPRPDPNAPANARDEAAAWVLRHDRGLRGEEPAAFAAWIADDPEHKQALARETRNWRRLDRLANPVRSRTPARRLRTRLIAGLALAAGLVIGFLTWSPERSAALALIEQRSLDDGTVVELNRDAVITVAYTPQQRRVILERGEAHFEVAKNPDRPFVVEAGGVAMRALGTAFNVRIGDDTVDVLVTHGSVQVDPTPADNADQPPVLPAGQRAVVPRRPGAAGPSISTVSPDDQTRLLAWRPRILDFEATSLAEIVAAFNQGSPVQLQIEGASLAGQRLSGRFRSDNLDGFVHLLEAAHGLKAERRGNVVVLRER